MRVPLPETRADRRAVRRATITSKVLITISVAVRGQLGLRQDDPVAFDLGGSGAILRRTPSERSTFAAYAFVLGTPVRPGGRLAFSEPVWTELHAAPGTVPGFLARFLDDTGGEVDFDLDERTWRRAADSYAA